MTDSQSTTAIDPVCGMKVNKASSVNAEHNDTTYYFCGERCKEQFLSAPGSTHDHEKTKSVAM